MLPTNIVLGKNCFKIVYVRLEVVLFPFVPVIPIICFDKIFINSSVCEVNLFVSITFLSTTIPGLLNIKSYSFNCFWLFNFFIPSMLASFCSKTAISLQLILLFFINCNVEIPSFPSPQIAIFLFSKSFLNLFIMLSFILFHSSLTYFCNVLVHYFLHLKKYYIYFFYFYILHIY